MSDAMLRGVALAVDTAGSAVVAAAVLVAAVRLLRREPMEAVRLALARQYLLALSFKSGAGVVRSAAVHRWSEIGLLVVIIVLRLLLGRVLKRETQWAARRAAGGAGHGENGA